MPDKGLSPAEMRADTQTDSSQLNAVDFLSGPVEYTVTGIHRNPTDDGKQPWNICLEGEDRFFRPCLTMRRILVKLWGDNYEDYIGRRMTLYCDETVMFGAEKRGGIRISHLSDIDGTETLRLTKSRTKRADWVIKPLETIKQAAKADDTKYAAVMAEGLTYIAKVQEVAGANGMLAMLKKAKHVGTSKADLWKAFKDRIAVVGVEYDAESKTCKPKE